MTEAPAPAEIIVLEDDASFIETLGAVLETSAGFRVAGSFRNPVRFLSALPDLSADLFLLDVHLPKLSGLECIKEIRHAHPASRIVMLSVHDDDDFILRAFLDGADGYLLKGSTPDEICSGLAEALRGGAPMSPSIARRVVKLLGRLDGERAASSPAPASGKPAVEALLTPREFEVLTLLADGQRYADIARSLFISHDTVKTHIRNIYEKLHVRNKAEAVARLLR